MNKLGFTEDQGVGIGKRVFEAVEKVQDGDPEGALIPVSIAIDATSRKQYGNRGRRDKKGKSRYKQFIHEYFPVITRVAFGGSAIGQLRVKYYHPEIKNEQDPDGFCSAEAIFYCVIRCGLLHEACLPASLKFEEGNSITVQDGLLVLPASLIVGLVMAVVVCPANADESLPSECSLNIGGSDYPLSNFWGKKDDLLALYPTNA